jgi:hypothetical protein
MPAGSASWELEFAFLERSPILIVGLDGAEDLVLLEAVFHAPLFSCQDPM